MSWGSSCLDKLKKGWLRKALETDPNSRLHVNAPESGCWSSKKAKQSAILMGRVNVLAHAYVYVGNELQIPGVLANNADAIEPVSRRIREDHREGDYARHELTSFAREATISGELPEIALTF